ncbi:MULTISPECIES: GIY-YIG nuclease family protein [unclassified Paenibacillus]|uniref:GIY-YIG nuclease family protein n=1 Tax=unclassified Paenibacillus TaxID=185978 RepID=UPI00240520DB|nr:MULTISPECIES: GIY-YIG nuclease family protein [unclassified Paenibacillus]MDF9841775.1 putative GIY-YIG superfamily endonuclease [Paenibacillus sp. PastF-2]MDF9848544.1 putative GIY-YIG superfamily endonuclease [Paenibacillus sp. PastM-2]MDF9854934.1 putative GIY-YIG superfamily endonuclease [Paenibacillus sp. PastF-1]MDH6480204.1 putative GIY-YIG superfamily endonuclease [Paenibacillus sp. PastH-2]MDH6507812.1 putative GIY-YIG superfamily endonuclease [Paenibacillus sp. PastM-3]
MGKKLTIYLIDGAATGPRTIEIGNWSGKAVYAHRSSLSKIIDRDEFDRPGVYILKSTPNSDNFSERIYIGEAENLKNRLKQHLASSEKDFVELAVFVSKDEMLTKAHIKYLEAKIIRLAREAKSAEIDNDKTPELTTLHEADRSDMEYYLEQIKLILPVVNFMFLVPSVYTPIDDVSTKHAQAIDEKEYLLKSKSADARLIETEEGFVVLAGSQCIKQVQSSFANGYLKLREKLIETQVLVDNGNFYVFRENAKFSSISAAAAVILGRSAAGPIEWIDTDGVTYKQNQQLKFSSNDHLKN